jgi:MFS family permease
MTATVDDTTTEVPGEPSPPSGPAALRGVLVGLLTLVTLIAFEAMAVGTAMPAAARAMHEVGGYGLALSAFLATSLFATALSGYWNDRSGPRLPLLTGLAAFTGGLLVSGTSPNFAVFTAGRALGGIGAGLVTVSLYVLVGHAFPAERRPKIFGWFSAAWVLPSLVGPAVSGWLTQAVSWRVVFLAVPPIAVAAVLALLPGLRRTSGGTPTRLPTRRLLAGAGVAVSATLLQWGAERLGTPAGIATAAVGVVTLVAALVVLLPAGTMRLRRGLPALIATRGMLNTAFMGVNTFIPLMLVTLRHLPPAFAGIALTTGAVGWSTGSWVQARVRGNAGHGRLVSVGPLVVGAGAILLAVVVVGLPTWLVGLVWFVAGTGMGAAMSSASVLLLNLSEPTEQGTNSSYLQLADSLGGVLGVGLAGAVFAAAHAQGPVGSHVFAVIWLMLAAVGVAAGLSGRRVVRRG